MVGYYGRDEETAAALRNGWLHTGDLGYLDDDGFLFISGRSKNVIISGGLNIYPAEIEQALMRHDAVAEAAVIPVPICPGSAGPAAGCASGARTAARAHRGVRYRTVTLISTLCRSVTFSSGSTSIQVT